MSKLTPKQSRFVEEYLVDLNAAAAYRRAGYTAKSDKVAAANAARLIANDSIAAAIAAGQASRTKRTEVSQDWVVERLVAEAQDCGESASHGARVKALELLGRHVGMWPNKIQMEGQVQLEVTEVVCRTRQEAAQALSAVAEAGRVS